MKIGIFYALSTKVMTGVGKYSYYLMQNLKNDDYCQEYFFIMNERSGFEKLNNIFIENPFKQISKTYLWYLYLPLKLRKTDAALDIIHNQSQIPTFFRFGTKYIITVHDITPCLFPKDHKLIRSFIDKLLLPKTLKTADKIIAVSYNTKQDLIDYFKVPDDKIKVIHLAADKKYQPVKKETISKFKQKYNLNFSFILYVGTLEPRKNIHTLIKAFSKLKMKDSLPHKLVIAGKKGWKYKSIFELIDKLNLQDDVIFTGYVPDEDLPSLYNAADLFVYPSIYEGFGLPPLEAMACGCPVITSNTSSLPEVVGDAGIMIDPYDVDGLAEATYNVLTNMELKEGMIKKGLERAKMFSWEKTAKETLKVYEEVYNS